MASSMWSMFTPTTDLLNVTPKPSRYCNNPTGDQFDMYFQSPQPGSIGLQASSSNLIDIKDFDVRAYWGSRGGQIQLQKMATIFINIPMYACPHFELMAAPYMPLFTKHESKKMFCICNTLSLCFCQFN